MDEPETKPARRIYLQVLSDKDLDRTIILPFQCGILIPSVGLDAQKIFGMPGVSMTLDRFLDVMIRDIAESPVPIAGKMSIEDFLETLENLKNASSMPWKLVLDDLDGTVDVEGLDSDTPENFQKTEYTLLTAEDDVQYEQLLPIANQFNQNKIKKICFVTGAGISVNSGIKDYRSKGGLYDSLQPDLFTATEEEKDKMRENPEYIVNINLFRENPLPMWEYKRKWILDSLDSPFKPTFAHWFIFMCQQKGLLQRVYTQNIDGIDLLTGLDKRFICQTHGHMQSAVCYFCKETIPFQAYAEQIRTNVKDIYNIDPTAPKESSKFFCPSCGEAGLKPAVVLFGEPLPQLFNELCDTDFPDQCDLMIIIGTSLKVPPVSDMPSLVSPTCLRLIINNKMVGDDPIRYTNPPLQDHYSGGDIDKSLEFLAQQIGWKDEILQLMNQHK